MVERAGIGPIAIRAGLHPDEIEEAAGLYWQAFGRKLGRLLGPEPLARRYLAHIIRPEQILAARTQRGRLIGLAGFRTSTGAVPIGRFPDLVAIYGWRGALWRATTLRLLRQDTDPRRFRVDGLAVSAGLRGQGVGSQLLDALATEAALRGYDSIRLDVAIENSRARALYERHGYVAYGETNPGPLGPALGFRRATRMERKLT